MKLFIILALIISTSAFATIEKECVEFTPHKIDDYQRGLSDLKDGLNVSNVLFEVVVETKVKGCQEVLNELDIYSADEVRKITMGLDSEISNENCVYTNKGSRYVYGWICKR